MLYFGAALAYLNFDKDRRAVSYRIALGLFVLALATKTVTATLPGALLVLAWWRHGRLTWARDWKPALPLFILGAISGLFTAWNEHTLVGARGEAFAWSPLERLLIASRVVWFYIGKLLWPADLSFIYPRWNPDALALPHYIFPAATILLLALLWRRRTTLRGPLAAALFFGGSLFPVLGFFNIFPFIFSFVADHFQYLASLGPFTLFAAGLTSALNQVRPALRLTLIAALLAPLVLLTHRHARNFADAETLYRATLKTNPNCVLAHGNLGILLSQRQDYTAALFHQSEVVRIEPNDPVARFDLGHTLFLSGQPEKAIAQYRTAIKLTPRYAEAHNNLGYALASLGRTAEAAASYREALRLAPHFSDARYNLALVLAQQGDRVAAVHQYRRVIAEKPDFAEAQNDLGTTLLQSGDAAGALPYLHAAVRINPHFARAHNNLGVAYHLLNRPTEALAHFQNALKADPEFVDAKKNLQVLQAPSVPR